MALPQISRISFDKPVIDSPYPLNEIIISKNGKELWRKRGKSINDRIEGLIQWPINPLEPNQEYLLSITPKGIAPGFSAKIRINTSSNESFKQLEILEKSLGNNKYKWINAIDKNLSKDKNLAYALLFSKRLPKSEILLEAKNKLISLDDCIK